MSKAYLVLDDGAIYEGESWACSGETFGEAVFSTGMTGYQETLTDPSYHKQVVVMTAPHIGNTGMNSQDEESKKIWVSGFVVRNPSPRVSNWRSEISLEDSLIDAGVVGIQGVDTRAITRHLRDRGAMRVGIFSGVELSREEMVIKVRQAPAMAGAFLANDVSTNEKYIVQVPEGVEKKFTVAALDLGIKSATPRHMAERGIEVHVFPSTATKEELMAISPDGVFLSNGPGDPATMVDVVELVRDLMLDSVPIFGICFGHQILGRALARARRGRGCARAPRRARSLPPRRVRCRAAHGSGPRLRARRCRVLHRIRQGLREGRSWLVLHGRRHQRRCPRGLERQSRRQDGRPVKGRLVSHTQARRRMGVRR